MVFADRRSWRFVWPVKCHYVGVIVQANIELSAQSSDVTWAATTQNSCPGPSVFSETLRAASTRNSESSIATSVRAGYSQIPASEDSNAQGAIPVGRIATTLNPAERNLLPQQASLAQRVASINPSVAPKQLSVESPIPSEELPPVETERPLPGDSMLKTITAESNIAQPAVVELQGVQSSFLLPGSGMVQPVSSRPYANAQPAPAPATDSPKTRNSASSVSFGAVAKTPQRVIQSAASKGSRAPLAEAYLDPRVSTNQSAQLSAFQTVAVNSSPDGTPDPSPTTLSKMKSSSAPIISSNASLKTAQSVVPNGATSEAEHPLSKIFPDTQSTVAVQVQFSSPLSVVQTVVPNSALGGAEIPLPKSSTSSQLTDAANVPSNALLGAVHSWAPVRVSDEFQIPLIKAATYSQSSPAPSSTSINPVSAVQVSETSANSQYSPAASVETNASVSGVQNLAPNTAGDEAPAHMSDPFPNNQLNTTPSLSPNTPLIALPSTAPSSRPNGAQDPLPTKFLNTQSSAAQAIPSNAPASAPQNAAPNKTPDGVADTQPQAFLYKQSTSTPSSQPNAASATVQNGVANGSTYEVQDPRPREFQNVQLSAVPAASSIAASNATQDTAPTEVPNGIQDSLPTVLPSKHSDSFAGVPSSAPSSSVQSAVAAAATHGAQILVPKTLPNTSTNTAPNVSLNADAMPVQHTPINAYPKRDNLPTSSPIQAGLASPIASSPDESAPATSTTVAGIPDDQSVTLAQPIGELLVTNQTAPSDLSPASVVKPSATSIANATGGAKDAAGAKLQPQPSTSHLGPQTNSQGTTSSGDQSQGGDSSQGQGTAAAPTSFAYHTSTTMPHQQSADTSAPVQSTPPPAGVAGHGAKTPDTASPTSAAVPLPLPVINTAKLIQSMGQSEMRVGMRSNEFGNISINTSATKDLISAQISLDHSELARTLAAHLPELQTRLGNNQPIDLRIDINRDTSGQGTGAFGSASGDSADGSRGAKEQAAHASSNYSSNSVLGGQFSPAAATMTTGDGALKSRLDIRV